MSKSNSPNNFASSSSLENSDNNQTTEIIRNVSSQYFNILTDLDHKFQFLITSFQEKAHSKVKLMCKNDLEFIEQKGKFTLNGEIEIDIDDSEADIADAKIDSLLACIRRNNIQSIINQAIELNKKENQINSNRENCIANCITNHLKAIESKQNLKVKEDLQYCINNCYLIFIQYNQKTFSQYESILNIMNNKI